MARDIEEFLRRAAERRRQAAQQSSTPPRKPQQQRPATPPPRQTITERDMVAESRSGLSSGKPLSTVNESVESHVKRYMDTSDVAAHAAEMAEHVSHLAEVVDHADERLEARLDQTFDHEVGNLGPKESVTDSLVRNEKSNAFAIELLDLFRDPKTVRQSILVAEILKRPDFDDV